MKKLIFLTIPILFSCQALKRTDCIENVKFKKIFFSHIENIKKNINIKQDAKFRESVIFISNYAPVSVNDIMNYSRTYPIGVFHKDLANWIKWYDENKCKNIQFKNSYIIPEAYKD